jgi:thioesterase domain-containing protein/acyl carrier protein
VARETVVTAHRSDRGDAHLVAYVVPERGERPTASALRQIVLARVPGQPVPASFVLLEALPLDANGKVNRRALPPPGQDRPELDVPFVGPRSGREAALGALWSELLGGRGPIGVDDDFFDVGGDSLLAVELVGRVAEATGIDVGVTEFAQRPTIRALAALVDGSRRSSTGGGPDVAARTLYFLHSDYHTLGAECVTLARQLAPDLKLVSVPPHGVDGGPVPVTIEEMAARHLERLRDLQPRGPYRLAGHCSAGMVAFELAQQLRAAGEDVLTLILIEPPPLRAMRGPAGRRQRLGSAIGRQAWHQAADYLARVHAATVEGRLLSAGLRRLRRKGQPTADGMPHRVDVAYAAAASRYAARPWPGPVTCIRTRASAGAQEFDPGTWRRVIHDLRLELVPGDHESCLVAEAAALADRLRAAMTDRTRRPPPA